MKCQASGCAEEAAVEIFWPGQTTCQCLVHAEKVVALGEFMGFRVETRPIFCETKQVDVGDERRNPNATE